MTARKAKLDPVADYFRSWIVFQAAIFGASIFTAPIRDVRTREQFVCELFSTLLNRTSELVTDNS